MKPIKLTQELIQQMTAEFSEALTKIKLSDGKVTYSKSFTYENDKDKTCASVLFEPEAYAKMLVLLHGFSDEVAWHGVVDRIGERSFVIKDILVYPQEVTGATVNTDQERYQTWLMELDDDTFTHLRMQGHSHVNFSTSPSNVDDAFYEQILAQLGDQDYYIFMIFNKRLERTVKIYDMKNNILYENKDVEIGIRSETGDLETFLNDAKDIVVKRTIGYDTSSYKSPDKTKETSKKSSKKSDKGNNALTRPYPGLYGSAVADDDTSEYDYGYGYGYGYGGGYGGGYNGGHAGYSSSYGGKDDGKVVDYDKEIFEKGRSRSNWWNRGGDSK